MEEHQQCMPHRKPYLQTMTAAMESEARKKHVSVAGATAGPGARGQHYQLLSEGGVSGHYF